MQKLRFLPFLDLVGPTLILPDTVIKKAVYLNIVQKGTLAILNLGKHLQ